MLDSFTNQHTRQIGKIMRTAQEIALTDMVSDGWAQSSDGDVEAPTGHFAIVEIDGHEMAHGYTTGDEDADAWIESAARGFYCVRENSDGVVFVDGPMAGSNAERWFADMAKEYADWAGVDDDAPCCYGYVTSGGSVHEVGCYAE